MSSLDLAAPARAASRPAALTAIAAALAALPAAIARARAALEAERQLSRLDDRMLKDIGLSAGNLPFAVRSTRPLKLSPGSDR